MHLHAVSRKQRIRSTRIWGNFWMLNLLVHFLLALHPLHVWERNTVRCCCCMIHSSSLQTHVERGAMCAASYRPLLPIQHILFGKEPQAVFESHFTWALLWRQSTAPQETATWSLLYTWHLPEAMIRYGHLQVTAVQTTCVEMLRNNQNMTITDKQQLTFRC